MLFMKKILPLLLIIFAVIGILDAGYITYEKLSGVVPPCTGAFKCGAVLNSPWASIGPIPLAAFGLAFYLTFLFVASLHLGEVKSLEWQGRRLPVAWVLVALGSFGFLFSLYLLGLMAFVIQAWCFYCLVSAINCIVLFSISWGVFKYA